MGSLCFSSASILRCESFTSLQSQLLIIPTALELIFATALVFKNWGTGRRHLLLTAEGWSYFALALLELLSHNLPAVRDNVGVFTIVDIVLGATSFLPIFFYTLFVYLFTRGELIDTLPKRFQRIANTLLLFFIPAIVALNELSSFVGISRRTIIINGRSVLAIGFRTSSDQQLWTFLTSLTLAILTAFEAINFCFAFYRLIRAFVDQRRIETTSTEQSHMIRGIGWISAGFKLGAIETVIGFAQGEFGGALVRRVLRLLSRAFLIIGIVKGIDQVDDFTNLEKEMKGGRTGTQRRSRLALLIGNPRFSTFRQLSPTAGEFYAEKGKARESITYPAGPSAPAPTFTYTAPPEPTLKRTMTAVSTTSSYYPASTTANKPNQRVTVHFTAPTGPPTLHMRFSGLEMPSPALIAETVKNRPVSAGWMSVATTRRSEMYTATSPNFKFDEPIPAVPAVAAYPEFIYEKSQTQDKGKGRAHTRGFSEFSDVRSSGYPESLSAVSVRELATQFPGPPPISSIRPPMPSPIPENGWGRDVEGNPHEEEVYSMFDNDRDSAYAPSSRTQQAYQQSYQQQPRQQQPQPRQQRPKIVTVPDPDSPEPVYKYSYDAPVSGVEPGRVEHPYVYAYSPAVANDDYSPPANIDAFASADYANNAGQGRPVFTNPFSNPAPALSVAAVPNNAYSGYNAYAAARENTRHRNVRSDTTLGTTPMTYQSSRFDQQTESSTPDTETETTNQDPFRFDAAGPALRTGASTKGGVLDAGYAFPREATQGVPEPVYMEDGPHGDSGVMPSHLRNRSDLTLGMGQRTSAALLQMTQRGDADWAPAGVEFTPSVFAPSTPSSSRHNTLKKKRRPSVGARSAKDVPTGVSAETLASSWLHGPDDEDEMFADDEQQQQQRYPSSSQYQAARSGAEAHRVKSVGRVRAPRKATPAPTRHGLTRGSVYIQPITVPPTAFSSEVQIVQGGSSADSYSSEFKDRP